MKTHIKKFNEPFLSLITSHRFLFHNPQQKISLKFIAKIHCRFFLLLTPAYQSTINTRLDAWQESIFKATNKRKKLDFSLFSTLYPFRTSSLYFVGSKLSSMRKWKCAVANTKRMLFSVCHWHI